MSFIITVHGNEGIVMASDSRTTYTAIEKDTVGIVHERIGIQTTDTTYKTFLCGKGIGISTCGTASINAKPIAGYIEDFIIKEITDETKVEDVPQKLLDYFGLFNPVPNTNFIIAGYKKNSNLQYIAHIFMNTKQIISIDTSNAGVIWDGETEVFKKLVKPVALKNIDGTYTDLLFFPTGFGYFTLQDAINYAEYAVDVTIKTMAFQDCVKTVGGPIDILVLKPKQSFWIKRKELQA